MKTKVISKRGGARPGAGRKPKLQYEARELFNAAIDERWPLIVQKLDEWIVKGDKDILRLVIEQRIGRASQSLAISKQDDTRPNINLFFQPGVQAAVRVFEDELKREICAAIVT
jgi:hypothetical protein